MKVIIKKTGQIKNVSDGYARNFLLPRGLATIATVDAVEKNQQQQMTRQQQKVAQEKAWEQLARDVEKKKIVLNESANDEGVLFGAVTNKELFTVLQLAGFTIEESWLAEKVHIKNTGSYTTTMTFPNKQSATIHFTVQKQ